MNRPPSFLFKYVLMKPPLPQSADVIIERPLECKLMVFEGLHELMFKVAKINSENKPS